MRTGRLPVHSTAVRLAAGVSGLFTAAILLAGVAAYLLVASELAGLTRDEVEEEVEELVRLADAEGREALLAEIGLRHRAEDDVSRLAFAPADGGPPVGDPAVAGVATGWRRLSEEALLAAGDAGADADYLALGRAVEGGVLTLARSTEPIEEAQEVVARALLWGLVAALALAGLGAAWIARRTEARIARIDAALGRAAAGDLAARATGPAEPADDLGRVAAAIDATLDRLEDAMASLRQVSADIAHDLKTPIQRLRGTLEGLRRAGRLDPEAEAVVEDALAQSDAIVRTFQALLRIAQIEGGAPRARFAPVDLVELVEAVGEAFGPALEEAGHRFALHVEAPAPCLVRGDRDLLAQMLSNLLDNARRHAPAPSTVALALEARGGGARLVVSDTGPGVPEAERERVFRRLYRLERSRTTEGSGLGLSTAAAVAELHGGAIRLEDAAPGLRVVVRLPLLTD